MDDPVNLPKEEPVDEAEKKLKEEMVPPPAQNVAPLEGKPLRRRRKAQPKEDASATLGPADIVTSPQDTTPAETTSLPPTSRTTSLVSEPFDSESQVLTSAQSVSHPLLTLQPPVKPKRIKKSKPGFSIFR